MGRMYPAVVDWNPCGVSIMKTYRFGSDTSLQASTWGLPALSWLAMHACQLDDLPEAAWQPLTPHDRFHPSCLPHRHNKTITLVSVSIINS